MTNAKKERRFDALSFGARGLLTHLLIAGRHVVFTSSDHGAELARLLRANGADHRALADALRELVRGGFATLRGEVLRVERAPVPRSVRRALRIRAAMYGGGGVGEMP